MGYGRDFKRLLVDAVSLNLDYAHRSERERAFELNPSPRLAAVLILWAFDAQLRPSLLFIHRADTIESHPGQIAFPGGKQEPSDRGDLILTALRETEEEVGISQKEIQVIGLLPQLFTVTGFQIQPVVALINRNPVEIRLQLDPSEVAGSRWISLENLLEPGSYRQESIESQGSHYNIDVYHIDTYRIWGATGSMVKNLLDRLEWAINL